MSSTTGDTATDTPPIIQINGDNPATIQVGATYQDLGATVTGPQADLNLGIEASVDGGATSSASAVQIDTSTPGTHTIEYSATDQNGLTGYATRTVTVLAPAPSIVPTDSASTTAPTEASSTATTTP